MNRLIGTVLLPALLLFLFTSCKKEVKNDTADESLISSSKNPKNHPISEMTEAELLKAVRQATSRYHSTTQAIKAGHQPDDHCVSVPALGGMGYHWVNPSLVDPVFDPLKPEAILYATGPDGELRLVALEYIVVNVGQPRPMFGTKPFDIAGTPLPVPHWSLHVWLYEENPSGIYMPFNPNITCP